MIWVNRRTFEVLLVLGAAAETAHLVGLFDRRVAVDGVGLAFVFTALGPWVTPLMGLAITRLRLAPAKWVFLFLMSLVWTSMIKLGAAGWWGDPWATMGFVAGIAQTLATLMILTPTGWGWTRKGKAGGGPNASVR